MAFHLRRQQKFVADPDEMSHQGTKQSHPQGLQHLSDLFTTCERQWLKSSALPRIAGTGAKYSFAGAIFALRPALPSCTPPLTLGPRTLKELVPHVIRLALSLSSVNTAGSGKIQSHPKSSPLWGNDRSRDQKFIHAGVTVIAAPKGSVHAGVTVVAAPRGSPRWGNGLGRAERFSPRWADSRSRAQRYSPRWGNGRNRAQWEKNLTCLASMSTFSLFRSSMLPSTTRATHFEILSRCKPVQESSCTQQEERAELVFNTCDGTPQWFQRFL